MIGPVMAAEWPMGWCRGETETLALNSKSERDSDKSCLAKVFVNVSDRQVLQPSDLTPCWSTESNRPQSLSHSRRVLAWDSLSHTGGGASTAHQVLSNRAGQGMLSRALVCTALQICGPAERKERGHRARALPERVQL